MENINSNSSIVEKPKKVKKDAKSSMPDIGT